MRTMHDPPAVLDGNLILSDDHRAEM